MSLIVGFHASSVNEFADAYEEALSLPEAECIAMRTRARKSALRFSEEVFISSWTKEMKKLLRMEERYRGERIYRTGGT